MEADDSPPWFTETKPKKKMELQFPDQLEKKKVIRNWFSNMELFDEPLVYEEISYASSENFYQAMKLPRSRQDLRKVIAALPPRKSKTEIRNTKKYTWDEKWDRKKAVQVMEYALRFKFQPGTSWHIKLMETGDEEIVEWNNWNDLFWGKDDDTKEGENHLGRILMHLRNEYRETKVVNKSSGQGISIMRGSMFGNPYSCIKDRKTLAEFEAETREESIEKFETYFLEKVKSDLTFKKAVLKLKNETLMCCCKPLSCHGDVILKWLFRQNSYIYES